MDRVSKVSELTLQDFDDHSVWTWADAPMDGPEDGVRPVDYPFEMACLDIAFIRAEFCTADGARLSGSVTCKVECGEVFNIDLLLGDRFVGFNVRLRDLADDDIRELQLRYGDSHRIFPIAYYPKCPWLNIPEGKFDFIEW